MRPPASHLDRLHGEGDGFDLVDLGPLLDESERARTDLEDTLDRLLRQCSAILRVPPDEATEHTERSGRGDLAHPGRTR